MKNPDGTIDQMPFVKISESSGDKYITWNNGKSRMDKLSNQYYGHPLYDWLILYANPEWISEFDIPDGATIRIPFPLDRAIGQYQEVLSNIKSE
jgi:hypothetical protein